jgi:hypothetical protein
MKKLLSIIITVFCFCIGTYASASGEYEMNISRLDAQKTLNESLPFYIENTLGKIKVNNINVKFLPMGNVSFNVNYTANIKGGSGVGSASFTGSLSPKGNSVYLKNITPDNVTFALNMPSRKKGVRAFFQNVKHHFVSKHVDNLVSDLTTDSHNQRLLIKQIEKMPVYTLNNNVSFLIKEIASISIQDNQALVRLALI